VTASPRLPAVPPAPPAEAIGTVDLARRVAEQALRCGALLLCTDFDGSIAPIRSRPGEVAALPGAERALAWLSRRGAALGRGARCPTRVAVVTARDSEDVAPRLALGAEAVVSGNYGLEMSRGGEVTVVPEARRWLPALEAAAVELEAELAGGRCPGARLERKRCGVVLHTRGVERPGIEACALELARSVAGRWDLAVVPGKRVAEIHLPVRRSKADAVRALRRGRWRTAALCVGGDDFGDIPMLRLARDVDGGVAVVVGDAETAPEVVAAARWRLPSPEAWADALTALVDALRL
jgi:trehalose 6-phosphate phosphatase